MRPYERDVIWEFDSLEDLRAFDPDFMDNVDSRIMDNICATLGCARRDISGIVPIKAGLTNLSFRFEVGGNRYVYRTPEWAPTPSSTARARHSRRKWRATWASTAPTCTNTRRRAGRYPTIWTTACP